LSCIGIWGKWWARPIKLWTTRKLQTFIWHTVDTAARPRCRHQRLAAIANSPVKGVCTGCFLWTDPEIGRQIHRPPKALTFSMESRVMRNVLQVDFLGLLHINAEGIVAIEAAVLIVIGVLVASRLGNGR
jgi:hypothetical protein